MHLGPLLDNNGEFYLEVFGVPVHKASGTYSMVTIGIRLFSLDIRTLNSIYSLN